MSTVSPLNMAAQAVALQARIASAGTAMRNISTSNAVDAADEFAAIFATLNGGASGSATGSSGPAQNPSGAGSGTALNTDLSSDGFNPSDIATFVPGYNALGATGLAALANASGSTASTITAGLTGTSTTTTGTSLDPLDYNPQAQTTAVVDGRGVTGSDVVVNAAQYLGQPYVWGGESLAEGGFDCSGLVQQVYRNLGYALPRTADVQQDVGTPVADLAHAQPGDLLFFHDPATHVGIYIGDGKMIEAPKKGLDVRVVNVDTWGIPVSSISRIIGDSSLLTPTAQTAQASTSTADVKAT